MVSFSAAEQPILRGSVVRSLTQRDGTDAEQLWPGGLQVPGDALKQRRGVQHVGAAEFLIVRGIAARARAGRPDQEAVVDDSLPENGEKL